MGVHKGIEWNDHKGMKMNGMYLSKGNGWKRIECNGIKELSNFDWMFWNKWMEMNENEWNISNFVWERYEGNGMKSFYDNITIRPLF